MACQSMNAAALFVTKYQPRDLCDFELDSEMSDMLQTLINMDSLTLLLLGDFGSGKTALLNALIREYYKGIPYEKYEENIMHINSLKEQGIHYYRNDVKTFCQTCCSIKQKKKFVVLDDIDFINEQSQQVFRNCIDKYKHQVHFIASATNMQKVIESLQSRFMIVRLYPLEKESLRHIMQKIKDNEKIEITPEAEEFVLSVSKNSVKVLINYMEKCNLLRETITLDIANQLCTNISFYLLEQYTLFLKKHALQEAIAIIYSIHDKGYSVMDILENYFIFIKATAVLSQDEKYKLIPLLCKYITIFYNVHEDEIELAMFTNNAMAVL